eukprot:5055678-Pyramimonas_sp.AAC.1
MARHQRARTTRAHAHPYYTRALHGACGAQKPACMRANQTTQRACTYPRALFWRQRLGRGTVLADRR